MANGTADDLVAWMAEARILEPGQQDDVYRLIQKGLVAPRSLAKELIARNWITPFQANYLIQNRLHELILGSFVLLERIGEGGMGTVYKAKHQKLGRMVAVKVVKKEYLAHPSAVRRFRREIQAATQLAHPNIVQALDADTSGETIWYAMEFIEGIDLRGLLKKSPLQVSQACDYMRQAALGLQHACERGLVHRDIKPSNLFVTTKMKGSTMGPWGLVKILDLGLARAADDSGDLEFTNTLTCAGAVVGTPDYIAPEQARDSRTADVRSDIYSLGCSFYHLLTGQVPFPGGTGMEKLFKQQLEMPASVRLLRPDVPAEVEAVLQRMMAKKPEERYQTPIEAARALEPLIKTKKQASGVLGKSGQEPTIAATDAITPVTPRKKRRSILVAPNLKHARRRPIWLPLAVACCGLVIATGLLFAIFAGEDDSPVVQQPTTQTASQPAQPRPKATHAKNRPLPKSTQPKSGPPKLASSPLDRLVAPPPERQGDLPPTAVALLGDPRLRHWGPATCAAFNADGTLLASGGNDRVVRIWNAASGALQTEIDDFVSPPSQLAFSEDGKHLVSVGIDLTVRVHDVASGELRTSVVVPRTAGTLLGLSPDGRTLLLTGPQQVKLWDVEKNQARLTLAAGGNAMAAYSADGRWLLTWSRIAVNQSSQIIIWNPTTGAIFRRLPGNKEMILSAAIANDGKTLAWLEAKELVVQETFTNRVIGRQEMAAANQAAFSPDGKTLLTAGGGRARLMSLANLAKPLWERRVAPVTQRMAFAADGNSIAMAGYEPTVYLLNAATGQDRFPGSRFSATQVLLADDDRVMVTAGPSGILRWDLTTMQSRPIEVPGAWQMLGALTPDGQHIVTRGSEGIAIWDTQGKRVGLAPGVGLMATFSADGSTAAVLNPATRALQVWDLTAAQPGPSLQGYQAIPNSYPAFSLSADGTILAIGEQGQVRLWDTRTGKPASDWLGQKTASRFATLAVSADGKHVAASNEGMIQVWDAGTGQEVIRQPDAGMRQPNQFAFAPDGATLIAWNHQRMLAWDITTGQAKTGFTGLGMIRALAFSADSETLAAADQDGQILVWNVATGSPKQRMNMPGPVIGLTFAADGRHLVTANGNGSVCILRLGDKHATLAIAPRRSKRPQPVDVPTVDEIEAKIEGRSRTK